MMPKNSYFWIGVIVVGVFLVTLPFQQRGLTLPLIALCIGVILMAVGYVKSVDSVQSKMRFCGSCKNNDVKKEEEI